MKNSSEKVCCSPSLRPLSPVREEPSMRTVTMQIPSAPQLAVARRGSAGGGEVGQARSRAQKDT